jgi:hypothetical protein
MSVHPSRRPSSRRVLALLSSLLFLACVQPPRDLAGEGLEPIDHDAGLAGDDAAPTGALADTAEIPVWQPYSPEEIDAKVAEFSWQDLKPLPEPPAKQDKGAIEDLTALTPLYYVEIYIKHPDELRELEEMGIHYDGVPLFEAEQPPLTTETVISFEGSQVDGGFFVFALMPAITFNQILQATLFGEQTYKVMNLRAVPAAARAADGISVSWAYLADNLLAFAPPQTHITDAGETAYPAAVGGDPVGGMALETTTLNLTCATGQTITDVKFASYGLPTGLAPNYAIGTCDAPSSERVVETACLGKTSCSIPATNAVFGDPCPWSIKRLSATVMCEGPADKRIGRRLRRFTRRIRDVVRTTVDGIRTGIGRLVTAVLPTSDITIDFHVKNRGTDYTGNLQRAWGSSTTFGGELKLTQTRVNVRQFGGISLYSKATNDNGTVSVRVRRNRNTSVCVEGDSAAARFERGFIMPYRHCFPNINPTVQQPPVYHMTTGAREIYTLAQFIDARKFARDALGYAPRKATVQTGKLAQVISSQDRAFVPCLAARGAPVSMVNAYVEAIRGIGLVAGDPALGFAVSTAIEFALSTDIVMPDKAMDSRTVPTHEYGHFFLCDLLAETRMQTYNKVWSQVISGTIPSQQASNEVIQLNEGFADWFASQAAGSADYFALVGGNSTTVQDYLWHIDGPAAGNGMESNVGSPSGPVVGDTLSQGVARFATLLHDVIDGNAGQQGTQLTTDTGVWSKTSPWKPVLTPWSDRADEVIQVRATDIAQTIRNFANSNGALGASLSSNALFTAMSGVLRSRGFTDAQICQLYSLHSMNGCPSGWGAAVTFGLTVTKTGTGTGTVTGTGINCGSDCGESFVSGTSVTLTASPAAGSTFAGWSGACTGTSTCTVSMSAARAVTANFNRPSFLLTVTKSGTGTVTATGINCGSDCSESFLNATNVTLTATPDVSTNFTGWSGACSGTGACTVSMTQARTVTANFAIKRFTLTVTRDTTYGNGPVTAPGINCPTDCSETYNYGTVVTLTAHPDGFTDTWSAPCTDRGFQNTCTVTMTQNRTMNVVFGRLL